MERADCKSYRPTSNLSVLSKTVERLVVRQLVDHLNLWKLMPDMQLAHRANPSTETAVPHYRGRPWIPAIDRLKSVLHAVARLNHVQIADDDSRRRLHAIGNDTPDDGTFDEASHGR